MEMTKSQTCLPEGGVPILLSYIYIYIYISNLTLSIFFIPIQLYEIIMLNPFVGSQEVNDRVHSQFFGVLMSDSPPHCCAAGLLQSEALHPSRLIQSARAAARRRHFHGFSKLRVVHGVHPILLRHRRHEPLAPHDLLGQERGPRLGGDAGGLHHPLQNDDHLDVLVLQIRRR